MKHILYILFVLLFSSAFSQGVVSGITKKIPKLTVVKSGPYFGLQRGKYNNIELGVELQRKRIKLVNPVTNALNIGFDYNLNENVLGFTSGYWHKRGRVNLTYGGMLVYKSNFDESKVGISPIVGYKFMYLHLQVGYNLLTLSDTFENTNTLFISLRFGVINNRKYRWRKKK